MFESARLIASTVVLFFILSSPFGRAEAALASPYFENAVKAYSVLKTNYQAEDKTNNLAYQNEIAPANLEIARLKTEIQACTTFVCAQEKQSRIGVLEGQTSASAAKYAAVGTDLYKTFVAAGNELAFEALSSELRASTVSDSKFSNVSFGTDSKCESPYRSRSLQYMMCRQINVEFKYDGHFYQVATAIGLRYGNRQCTSGYEWDGQRLDKIFSSTRAQFMVGVNPMWFFLEDIGSSMGREKGSDVGNWCSGYDYLIWGSEDPDKGLIGFHVVKRTSI